MQTYRFALVFALLGAVTATSFAAPKMEYTESSYITNRTRLWNEPNKFGEALAVLEPGLRVEVLTYTSAADWVEVRTPGGREGWVLLRFTALANRRNADVLVGTRGMQTERPRDPAADGDMQALTSEEPPPEEYTGADAAGGGGSDLPTVESRKAPKTDEEGAEHVEAPADGDTRRARYAPEASQLDEAKGKKKRRRKRNQDDEDLGEGSRDIMTRPEFNFGVGYHQQLTPEGMSGFAFTPRYFRPMGDTLDWGVGLDWIFVQKTTKDLSPDIYASTRKRQNHFNINAGLRYRKGAFRGLTTLGFDIQRTSRRTIDLDDNSEILTNAAGEYVTGSGWSHGIRLRLAPAYMFIQEAVWSVGVEAFYSLRFEINGESGAFAGPAGSRVAHSLGLGITASRAFE